MRTDDHLAGLEGIRGRARRVEIEAGIESLVARDGRREIARGVAPHLMEEKEERHPGGIRGRRQGDRVAEFRLPEVVPGLGRRADLGFVVDDPDGVVARRHCEIDPAGLVDRRRFDIAEILEACRIEIFDDTVVVGDLADAAVHPRGVDARRGLLRVELAERHGRGADLGVDPDPGRAGEGIGDAGLEGVAPVAAVPGDGDGALLRRRGAGDGGDESGGYGGADDTVLHRWFPLRKRSACQQIQRRGSTAASRLAPLRDAGGRRTGIDLGAGFASGRANTVR